MDQIKALVTDLMDQRAQTQELVDAACDLFNDKNMGAVLTATMHVLNSSVSILVDSADEEDVRKQLSAALRKEADRLDESLKADNVQEALSITDPK